MSFFNRFNKKSEGKKFKTEFWGIIEDLEKNTATELEGIKNSNNNNEINKPLKKYEEIKRVKNFINSYAYTQKNKYEKNIPLINNIMRIY